MRALILLTSLCVACPAPPATPPAADPPASQPTAAPEAPTGATQASKVQVEQAWIRAVPPGSKTSALFATLKNAAPSQSRLVRAETDAAKNVELHTHIEEDGQMKMRRVDGMDLPGSDHRHLMPSGDHIMLIGLQKDLVEGEEVSVKLVFSDDSEHEFRATVRKEAPEATHKHGKAATDPAEEAHGHGHGHGHEHEGH